MSEKKRAVQSVIFSNTRDYKTDKSFVIFFDTLEHMLEKNM